VTVSSDSELPDNVLLAISLHGSGIDLGTVSAGTVCRYTNALRVGLQATIEIVEAVSMQPTVGRRKRWVERMADLPLIGIEAGELRILLGEPKRSGLFADAERESFASAVDLLFQALHHSTAQGEESLNESRIILPVNAERKLLEVVARLMPPRRGALNRITIWRHVGGDVAGQAIAVTLDRSSRDRLGTQLRQRDGVPVS